MNMQFSREKSEKCENTNIQRRQSRAKKIPKSQTHPKKIIAHAETSETNVNVKKIKTWEMFLR